MEIKPAANKDIQKHYEVSGLFNDQKSADGAVLKIKELGLVPSSINTALQDLTDEDLEKQKENGPFSLYGGLFAGVVIGGTIGSLMNKATIPWGIVIGGLIAYLLFKNNRQNVVRPLGVLLSVHCENSDWANKINKLFEVSGAHNIYLRSEYKH